LAPEEELGIAVHFGNDPSKLPHLENPANIGGIELARNVFAPGAAYHFS
jgi:hypothetical protein